MCSHHVFSFSVETISKCPSQPFYVVFVVWSQDWEINPFYNKGGVPGHQNGKTPSGLSLRHTQIGFVLTSSERKKKKNKKLAQVWLYKIWSQQNSWIYIARGDPQLLREGRTQLLNAIWGIKGNWGISTAKVTEDLSAARSQTCEGLYLKGYQVLVSGQLPFIQNVDSSIHPVQKN